MLYHIQSDYKTKVTRLERDESKLQSDLTAQRAEVSRRNQTILTLQTNLETAGGETVTLRASYDSKVAENTRLRSDLVARREEVVRRYQTITDLQSELQAAHGRAATLEADYNSKTTENDNLRTSLAAQRENAAQADQTRLDLESDLEIAWREVDRVTASYDSKVTENANLRSDLTTQTAQADQTISRLQSELGTTRREAGTLRDNVSSFQRSKSELQSAIHTLKGEIAEAKLRMSPGIGDFKQWMRKNSINTDSLIDLSSSSSDMHHVHAHNALMNLRAEKWSLADEDAKRVIFRFVGVLLSIHPHVKSIDSRSSAMGYIAKAVAQIGLGDPEKAMQVFDLGLANCNPDESNLLLLIKVSDPYIAGL